MLLFLNFLLLFTGLYSYAMSEQTLQQLHVIFRHGDRSPEKSGLGGLYPKDPNINDTWYPEGFGQLTLYGKNQEYNIGKALRQQYDQFLGRIYLTDLIDPVSTDYSRTRMSLELVLAGLFPPARCQVWNNVLPWQPIPYGYVSIKTDPVMRFALLYYQKYIDLFNEVFQEDVFQNFFTTYADLIDYVSENTGLPMKSLLDLTGVWMTLYAEVQTGRKIPKWTKIVFPNFLEQASILFYEQQTYNSELRKLSGGNMLKKIITDARCKKNGTLSPEGRKLFLYSGHEYNIAYILGALNVFKPHIPPYASYVIIELHEIEGIYGFKILYQDYSNRTPQYLTLSGCDVFCPFDKFIDLVADNIPDVDTI